MQLTQAIKQRATHPFVIAGFVCALLVIIGTTFGWFSIGNELARSYVADELEQKRSYSALVAVIAAAIIAISVATKRHRLSLIAVPVCLYGALLVSNQMPDSDIMDSLDISANIGFWLSLLGSFGAAISSGMIGFKGFSNPKFSLREK